MKIIMMDRTTSSAASLNDLLKTEIPFLHTHMILKSEFIHFDLQVIAKVHSNSSWTLIFVHCAHICFICLNGFLIKFHIGPVLFLHKSFYTSPSETSNDNSVNDDFKAQSKSFDCNNPIIVDTTSAHILCVDPCTY